MNRRLVTSLVLLAGMVLWMGYFFYFRTDGQGHVLREADNPAAQGAGQQLLSRADGLVNQQQYEAARALLDSLRDADANPNMFISTAALEQRFDTLRARRHRAHPAR